MEHSTGTGTVPLKPPTCTPTCLFACSQGLGFVEFESHEDAVCALRELNNNPTIFSKDRRPIVEFAVENVKILKMREAKMKRKGAEEGPTGADKKKVRGWAVATAMAGIPTSCGYELWRGVIGDEEHQRVPAHTVVDGGGHG